ncbi:MAG: hypothetical protein D6698_16670 [Gammaproteobacteria bacterium]|nr:MAG: hypothetical protein D6698_16670 [Gammaproteobacteria bacterium]
MPSARGKKLTELVHRNCQVCGTEFLIRKSNRSFYTCDNCLEELSREIRPGTYVVEKEDKEFTERYLLLKDMNELLPPWERMTEEQIREEARR